jgi:acyl-CoA synthetase (NDP forming)
MDQRLKMLDALFHPRTVAFVGATETVGKWGFIIYNNLLSGGYEGGIYPVNPGRDVVLGHKAYPSVTDIPGEVDLAVFTVPAKRMAAALDDCVKKGVKAGVVISAGFKELGGESADLEAKLAAKARAGHMVLVGPNGQGVCCPESKLYPWIPPNFTPPAGEVAVISQSGNIQTMLISEVARCGFGVSKSVSSGNEADLKTEDYFEYFAHDPATKVILAYLEGITDGRTFIERSRAVSKKKPVIVYKGGSTGPGVSAARSHTGAMAVSDELFDSVCRQSGLIRAARIEEAGTIASSFLDRPLPRGKRVAIVTGGGGLGVIAADVCSRIGLEVPALSGKTLERIGELMPEWWVPGNPVDMVAGLRFGTRKPILEILMKSGEVDSIILLRMGPPPNRGKIQSVRDGKAIDPSKIWEALAQRQAELVNEICGLMHESGVPVYIVSNLFQDPRIDASKLLGDRRVTIYTHIDTACLSIKAMSDYFERLDDRPP